MVNLSRVLAVLPVAIAYFVATSISMMFDAHSGGVAFLWAGTAIIIADLSDRPPAQWAARLPAFLVASFLASTLFGRGWPDALPVGLADLVEACVAAYLLSVGKSSRAPLGSLAWLIRFVIPVGFAAPAAVGSLMAIVSLLTGYPPLGVLPGIVVGHALGNVLLTPLVMLVRRGGLRNFGAQLKKAGQRREAILLLGLVAVVTAGVFAQQSLPLLFLPVLPLILVSFRLGHGASGVAVVIVAAIGTSFTFAGAGPAMMIHGPFGEQLLFLQFYFAATVLTALPVAADLETREQLHHDVRLSEERYRLLAEHSSDILMHLEVDGRIRFVSPSIRQLGGYDPATLIGTDATKLVAAHNVDAVRLHHRATAAACGADYVFDFVAVTKDGEERWFETHGRAIVDANGRLDGLLSIIRDVSVRKAVEAELAQAALTDPLTGLPNRRGFERAAADHVGSGRAGRHCVAVFDVDHFKQVNDGFGHDAGDAVLRQFAVVMRRVLRRSDEVARTGGEEFAVLFPNTSVAQALDICDRLRTEMAATMTRCGTNDIRVTISGGVAKLTADGLDKALKDADEAMYCAKRAGRDRMALAA